MKAVILAGGYGARLRPLTFSLPKPLVEFANKPIVLHQIEALCRVGCTEIILAIAYRQQVMTAFVREWEDRLGIRIVVSEEPSPLGTAGPLALVRDLLTDASGEPFFLLNGDVLCAFPLQELLQFHHANNAEVTLLIKEVQDPSRFGAVVTEGDGKVRCFVEKPTRFLSAKINAGIYIVASSVLSRIEDRPTSLEKEILPAIAAKDKLYAMTLQSYWSDLGQPEDYLNGGSFVRHPGLNGAVGLRMYLENARLQRCGILAEGTMFEGNVLIGRDVQIGANCRIGPNVCLGDGCVIGRGVRLMNCAVMHGTHIDDYAFCRDSLIGWQSVIGKWCRLENGCTFGESVLCKVTPPQISTPLSALSQDELMFNGAVILPNRSMAQSVMQPDTIL